MRQRGQWSEVVKEGGGDKVRRTITHQPSIPITSTHRELSIDCKHNPINLSVHSIEYATQSLTLPLTSTTTTITTLRTRPGFCFHPRVQASSSRGLERRGGGRRTLSLGRREPQ
ncbi:hypothetical protein Pcinc_039204 [Petrolisthes cinctipes]|uniref:Uncharacterized protein n=1 Tax=Petrolisthes cinctipes TaxID=88211 RepID=A0AAE1BNX2_PETCI|nr:hypothetical protein Pcinc_039204 [Petrolisthes cinctipes]